MKRSHRREVTLDVRKLEIMKAKIERRIDNLKRELTTIVSLLEKCQQELALKEAVSCPTSQPVAETY
jgi:hypothetical protein